MKSLDLKSVNVQALNDDELRLVDGGFVCGGICITVAYLAGVAVGAACLYLVHNQD